MGKLVTITERNYHKFINPTVNGELKVCGTKPRDFKKYYAGYGAAKKFSDVMEVFKESDMQDRLELVLKERADLYDVRRTGMFGAPIPSLDQNGKGYCWGHSPVSAMRLGRAVNNQPFRDLSPYAICCKIKNYRDQGGWNAEAVNYIAEHGCPTSEYWPQRSMDRKNDNAETWADAKKSIIVTWIDLEPKDMQRQLITCLLLGFPIASDFNWWGHSVCSVRLKQFKPLKTTIFNSWGDWSDEGMGDLEGKKAIPDSAIALMTTSLAA